MTKENVLFLKALIKKLKSVKEFNQSQGVYEHKPGCPSCVGAHIAHHFTKSNSYKEGADLFYMRFSKDYERPPWNWRQINQTLHFCGSSPVPFSGVEWKKHPKVVFTKFLKMGKPISQEAYRKFLNKNVSIMNDAEFEEYSHNQDVGGYIE